MNSSRRSFLRTASCLSAAGYAGEDDKPGNLDLRLHPKAVVRGVPQAFTFELVNMSNSDIRLPDPAIQCVWGFSGTLSLNLVFIPLSGIYSEGTVHGCGGALYDGPPILERVKSWKILRPGESLRVVASRDRLFYDDKQLGTYEFRATYSPPDIGAADRKALQEAGINVPLGNPTTPRLRFIKKR